MSFLGRFKDALLGRGSSDGRGAGSIAGHWRVVDISVPHPFGRYNLVLAVDGVLQWTATLPTRDAGEIEMSGSGTWSTAGDTLHYTSGEHAGTLRWTLDDERSLVLDGLPAANLAGGARCVLEKAGAARGV
jgi:hypothetical protein